MSEQILSEKYRPKTVDECILPEATKDLVNGIIKDGNILSLLFVGSPGCGKTTLARAIANEMGANLLFINASLNGNIDTLRGDIIRFAKTSSMSGSKKITVLDEADGLTQATQQALRGVIEECSNNHTFIFTANYENKIIEAIHSRCKVINFKISKKEKPEIAKKFLRRVFTILDAESIEYEREAVATLVMKKFPDFRSVLNELQGYSAGGKIDSGILASLSDEAFGQLITSLKEKKFNDIRKWVGEHSDIESVHFFRMFYDKCSDLMQPKSIPELIIVLGDYSYKDYFMADKEINRMAFLTTLLVSSNIEWK